MFPLKTKKHCNNPIKQQNHPGLAVTLLDLSTELHVFKFKNKMAWNHY